MILPSALLSCLRAFAAPCLVVSFLVVAGCSSEAPKPAATDPNATAPSPDGDVGADAARELLAAQAARAEAPTTPPGLTPPGGVTPPVSENPGDHPGFKVEVLKEGEGKEVVAGSTVKVRYVGTLRNGKQFDSSWQKGLEPAEFNLSGVVPGFRMGLLGMKVGGHRRVTVPGALGYGQAGSPGAGIGPNETLTFDLELVEVVN